MFKCLLSLLGRLQTIGPHLCSPDNVCERCDIVLVVLGVTQGSISLSLVSAEHTRCGRAPTQLHV